MTKLNRRRFIAVAAACTVLPTAARPTHVWRGQAMGAVVTIRLSHPQAQEICARAAAEIDRLEDIFSLYRPGSALMRLNDTGHLDTPPFELLECLSLAGQVHGASGGLFDPTVQPLWQTYAEAFAAGAPPGPATIRAALARTGWHRLRFDADEVRLDAGMALTLNGIAQGYVADRVARLLQGEGLDRVLIDTGEIAALGPQPDGAAWPVTLADGTQVQLGRGALATSSPLGTVFDVGKRIGHILDPGTGKPAPAFWKSVTISAASSAVADALSTAACLTTGKDQVEKLVANFPGSRIESLT